MTETNKEFRNIKSELTRMGVTQKQVAEHFHMSVAHLNAKINGRVPFSVPQILEMRDEFMPEASLDYLLRTNSENEGSQLSRRGRGAPSGESRDRSI